MANSAQARKRAGQADKRRERNKAQMSAMRTAVKKVRSAIDAGDKAGAQEAFKAAQPSIDNVAGKGRIHANTAARYKSRLNKAIRAMA
ncbi:MAG: 30S ribosomal protein S20 [Gammaproteobacteria bacterium]